MEFQKQTVYEVKIVGGIAIGDIRITYGRWHFCVNTDARIDGKQTAKIAQKIKDIEDNNASVTNVSEQEISPGDLVVCHYRNGFCNQVDAIYVCHYDGYPVVSRGKDIVSWTWGDVERRQPPNQNQDTTGRKS